MYDTQSASRTSEAAAEGSSEGEGYSTASDDGWGAEEASSTAGQSLWSLFCHSFM